MSTDLRYEIALAECHSLRQQLKNVYGKCSDIYEALAILDEHSTKERDVLEKLVRDLKQTIQHELTKNEQLSVEKLQMERNEEHFKQELHNKTEDLKKITVKYRRIYVNQQQEKYIQDHLTKPKTKKSS